MAEQHRPFRMPHETQEVFDARVAEHAARIEHASTQVPGGPQWQNPRDARKPAEPKAPRDYARQARATLIAADQGDPIVAAVIIAQAIDRLTDKITEAAAIVNYKRGG